MDKSHRYVEDQQYHHQHKSVVPPRLYTWYYKTMLGMFEIWTVESIQLVCELQYKSSMKVISM